MTLNQGIVERDDIGGGRVLVLLPDLAELETLVAPRRQLVAEEVARVLNRHMHVRRHTSGCALPARHGAAAHHTVPDALAHHTVTHALAHHAVTHALAHHRDARLTGARPDNHAMGQRRIPDADPRRAGDYHCSHHGGREPNEYRPPHFRILFHEGKKGD